jgi:hypothetical protein
MAAVFTTTASRPATTVLRPTTYNTNNNGGPQPTSSGGGFAASSAYPQAVSTSYVPPAGGQTYATAGATAAPSALSSDIYYSTNYMPTARPAIDNAHRVSYSSSCSIRTVALETLCACLLSWWLLSSQ